MFIEILTRSKKVSKRAITDHHKFHSGHIAFVLKDTVNMLGNSILQRISADQEVIKTGTYSLPWVPGA